MADSLASPLSTALHSHARPINAQRFRCGVQIAQQRSKRLSQGPTSWGTGELKSADISTLDFSPGSAGTSATPLDVLLDDVRFLEAKTGLDLMTPLQEVKEVHDQVVAALNPIAGEKMQEELEQRISALQNELETAHTEVHMSEERLESTIEELTRLEMAAHGFTAALSHRIEEPSVVHAGFSSSISSSSSMSLEGAHTQQQSSSAVQAAGRAPIVPAQAEASASSACTVFREASSNNSNSSSSSNTLLQDPQQREKQRQFSQPPERQRKRSRGESLHSDLDLPDELKDFWFPVAFSSQLKGDEMVTMELFGEPWVLFRDAQGLAACVKDACAHRACPLSLGSVVEGCIQCPYHGWQYDGSGNCTRMPSTAFCRGISVSSLPVREADGFAWVWPGQKLPEPAVPAVTRPPEGFEVHAELILEVPVEHGLLLENLLDLAHAPFTHTSTFAKGWPIPDVVKFNAQKLLGGNWEPYPIDMAFEPPCMVLSTIGLAQPGKIERGARAAGCRNHLHQLHVCLPAGPGRSRLLYRMSMDFLHWTKHVPFIEAFWAHIAKQVMGEDLVLVSGQQDRMLRGADVWSHPVAYDKLGVRYRRWRNSVTAGRHEERREIENELRPMSAGELFRIPEDGCNVEEGCDVSDQGDDSPDAQ
ncbi:hypothetical protein CVIRNUC_005763 [Coccomyxa viridis]|uniref:Rieske domain-containing protein n=1 Tax=Coccomyxa viridis TaxID=1274662 RepID=A0AAV1I5F2_9CHLO|nr:hypothetical protein CVIRNUC_005763 [Coccomyxa viridis]